ncbi:MAG: isoprenylcysteine carboxylmethyltransferase family protein [Clostridia bacterium]|nr:isoprenylcysteine carboxylmethyltransferase family protein [Clostridia bacterium]
MYMKLLLHALLKFILGIVFMGAVLFLPAGTLQYPNAWLFMALLFIPMLLLGAVLFCKAPQLLKKRLNSKEKEKTQAWVITLSSVMFLASFVLAGLDFRFGWSNIPWWGVAIAAVLQLAAYALYAEVMRENAYLSRTVEVQEDQKVIDTGLYGIVRHPMYAATVLLYLAMPVVLGSWYAFLVMLLYPILIVFRIHNEEKVLESGLAGYAEYKKKVKYRLIPFVW